LLLKQTRFQPAYFICYLDVVEKAENNELPKDEQQEISESPNKLMITNLKTHSIGAQISIEWTVSGDSTEVRAYQVEQRPKGSSDSWRQAGNYVPNQPGQTAYKQLIDHNALANKQVEIRVRAIGPDGNALAHSQIANLSGECESKFVPIASLIYDCVF
jgi:fibronectin type 3 domain-containing protein